MKTKCIAEIEAALGRKASDAEIAKIEGALRGAMKKVYRDNPSAAKAMKAHEMYAKAVKLAANDLIDKAVEAKLRTASNALKMARKQAELQAVNPLQQIRQLLNMLIDKAALDRNGSQSIESRQKAMAADAWSKLPTLQTLLADNKKLSGPVLSEIFGERTGDAEAAKAAQEFRALNDELITAARHAGMPITPLDNWNMPQGLSSIKVAGDFEKAIDDLINHIDPNIYRHENGELYTPEELRHFMTEAATTLAADGANKDTTGFRTGSGRSYQKERQIHYKDAAAWRYMQDKYGDKTAGQLISQHIHALSRDIALTENFGSDYRGGFKELLRQATLTARMAAQDDKARMDVDAQAAIAQRYFDNLAGDAGHTTAQGAAWARRFDIVRNMITFSTMGGAGINSIPDMAGFSMIAKLSNVPEIKLWSKTMRNFLLSQNKADVELADRIGLGVQTLLAELQRNVRDDPLLNFSAKAANFTVVGGLLTRFERSKAMAVANVMHDAIGALTRNHDWENLPAGDRHLFEANGIDENTFKLWQAADIERGPDGKNTILLPQHIYSVPNEAVAKVYAEDLATVSSDRTDNAIAAIKRDAALKLSGVIGRETRLASGTPGVQRRVDLNMDAARTGLTSEIQRSITFLKATPMSIVHNYWERAGSSSDSKAGAMAMRARYLATSAVLGVMIYNLKSLFNGQDMFNPFDTEQDHYWTKITKSVLTGGGMGIYGDLLLQDYSGAHSTTAFSGILGGPIIGTADDLGQIFADVKRQTVEGEGDLGGDTIRFIKRHAVPNFFYTKALLDHAFFQQAQEYFSPGYNHRVNRRLEKGSGTQAWWPAGEVMPERAPAFSK